MKKNSIKYMLGTALIGVWGLLGFRFYEKLNKPNNFQLLDRAGNYSTPEANPRTYNLSLDYQDPFLGKKFKKPKATFVKEAVSNPNRKNTRFTKKKPSQKKKKKFPSIVYKGNIRTDDGREVALMNFNGAFIQLEKAKSHEKLKLMKVYQDSIKVQYLGEEKTIRRIR